MFQNFRFGLRLLRKQPGFAAIAVVTLALGIGATSAVFSLAKGVLLTPPPYQEPQRLVLIPAVRTGGGQTSQPRGWAPEQWLHWQKEAKSLAGVAAYDWRFNFLIRSDGSESMQGMAVTADYFRILGLRPLLGRAFLDSETGAKPQPVILLGYEFWQRKFNGDPAILGKTIRVSRWDAPATVVGVMPPDVRFLPSPGNSQEPNYDVNARVAFWSPAGLPPDRMKEPDWNVIARLRDGATLAQAQAELSVLAKRQAQANRDYEGIAPELQPLTTERNAEGRRILLPLSIAAALVLLIACGNAAALLLVRGVQRQQEYAVRCALGVSRRVLFLQVSSENLLLALFGGALGVGLAFGTVKLFKLIGGQAIPRLEDVTTGWPLLASAVLGAMLSTLLAGVVPALRASRLDPMAVLKSAGTRNTVGRGERRVLRTITMGQTALTLALLVGAGLLIRTMLNLAQVSSGYDTSHTLTMTVTAVQGDWLAFHRQALERVSALPGVQNAAFAWGVPLTGNSWPGTVEIEGQPAAAKASDRITLPLRSVTPGYFKLLGMEVLDGRDFRSTDNQQAPNVAVVNRAFADRYFPRENPIGKKIWPGNRQEPPRQIVGVVNNTRTADLAHTAEPEIYLSLWQASPFSKHLVVRTAADPKGMVRLIERELHSIEPTAAVEQVKTLDEIRNGSQASRRFAMQLLVGFAAVGSLLTLVGVYGVLSLSVASRRREIAIRSAVGAELHHIRKLVFADGFRLIGGGVLLGIVAALVLSRVLTSFLFGVRPTDPPTLLGVGFLFVSVALLACWAPARRATKVEPSEALRSE